MKADEASRLLRAAFDAGRLAQGYVIVAPPRTEGAEFAGGLLKALFCSAERGRPCDACAGCRQAEARTHPDLAWVEPEKRSRIISVDQIRGLQGRIYQTSYAGGWKACVMVSADRLRDEAANAFLKTLEEPPARTVFLLLTDSPQFLLPTIRSRCQWIALAGAESTLPESWRERLLEILATPRQRGSAIAAYAAADRLAALFKEMRDTAQTAEEQIARAEAVEEDEKTVDARASARYRELRTAAIGEVLRWYRDLLLITCGADRSLLHHGAHAEALAALAGAVDTGRALRNLRVIEDMNRQFERNMPENSVLPLGFMRLAG